MIKELVKFTKTFELFKEFLYKEIYKGNSKEFKRFPNLPNEFITAKALDYLDSLHIPLVDALVYYNYKYPNAKFQDKLNNLVIKEFYRLENNIKCDYIPF